ncbi:uncharacterized protein LOC109605380 isoform X3 [Aethina tumida]|uniref:uncharacterized protein LOC109605380 isoform X3 n=1 Tax=Aethina tumida TaxID=116153 RepID=UPI00214752EC|nr:uncharacterized protein LOC109605380 isoform X3 [Aethina tumida]
MEDEESKIDEYLNLITTNINNKIYNETFVKQMWSFINLLINELRMSRATINEQKASLNILVKSEGFSMNTRYVELKNLYDKLLEDHKALTKSAETNELKYESTLSEQKKSLEAKIMSLKNELEVVKIHYSNQIELLEAKHALIMDEFTVSQKRQIIDIKNKLQHVENVKRDLQIENRQLKDKLLNFKEPKDPPAFNFDESSNEMAQPALVQNQLLLNDYGRHKLMAKPATATNQSSVHNFGDISNANLNSADPRVHNFKEVVVNPAIEPKQSTVDNFRKPIEVGNSAFMPQQFALNNDLKNPKPIIKPTIETRKSMTNVDVNSNMTANHETKDYEGSNLDANFDFDLLEFDDQDDFALLNKFKDMEVRNNKPILQLSDTFKTTSNAEPVVTNDGQNNTVKSKTNKPTMFKSYGKRYRNVRPSKPTLESSVVQDIVYNPQLIQNNMVQSKKKEPSKPTSYPLNSANNAQLIQSNNFQNKKMQSKNNGVGTKSKKKKLFDPDNLDYLDDLERSD